MEVNIHSINQLLRISLQLTLILCFPTTSDIKAQNYWEQTSGPQGGAVKCMTLNRNNMIFSGFDASWFGPNHNGRCIYRSENEGEGWEPLYLSSNKDVHSIAIDTSNAIYIWSGGRGVHKSIDNGNTWIYKFNGTDGFYDGTVRVFKNNFVALGQEGVYISTDEGSSWNETSLTGSRIHTMFIDNEDNLFAALYSGLVRTSDYGISWQQSDQGLNGDTVNSIIQYEDSIYVAGSSSGIFRSVDRGLNWSLIPGSPTNVTSICKSTQGAIFAGTQREGCFYSLDQGNSWSSGNNGLLNYCITALLTLPSGAIIAGTYGDGMFVTSNQGQSWSSINQGVISTHITAFFKYKEYLFAGSQHGMIYRSSDRGDTWIRNDYNNSFMPVMAFCKSSKNSLFYSSYYYPFKKEYNSDHLENTGPSLLRLDSDRAVTGRLYKSDDEGNTWIETAELYVNALSAYFDSLTGNEYLLAGDYRGVYISTDDGKSWYPSTNGIQGYIDDVAINSIGYFYASSANNIFRSTNFGSSWQIIYNGASTEYKIILEIPGNHYIYAGQDWGKIILSTDNGETWLYLGANFIVNRINSIAVDSLGNIFAGNWWGEIFKSVNNGISWNRVNSGMIGGPILNLFCDSDGSIFVGPYGGGVFRGVGTTFTPLQVKLASPHTASQNVVLNPTLKWFASNTIDYRFQLSSNKYFDSLLIIHDEILSDTSVTIDSLIKGSYYSWRVAGRNEFGWSIWSDVFWFKTILPTDINDDRESRFSYRLDQNFPNPFNPLTTIGYSLSEYSKVTIKIYDILGNEIKTLVNREEPAGVYDLTWDAGNLPSGIYFYKIQAGTYTETKKMILMK